MAMSADTILFLKFTARLFVKNFTKNARLRKRSEDSEYLVNLNRVYQKQEKF